MAHFKTNLVLNSVKKYFAYLITNYILSLKEHSFSEVTNSTLVVKFMMRTTARLWNNIMGHESQYERSIWSHLHFWIACVAFTVIQTQRHIKLVNGHIFIDRSWPADCFLHLTCNLQVFPGHLRKQLMTTQDKNKHFDWLSKWTHTRYMSKQIPSKANEIIQYHSQPWHIAEDKL